MATTNPIEEYLATLDEPKRATLTSLRDTIMAIVPEAEQCISYAMPAFKLRGKTIAGFAAFKNHLSYLPHSGSVIPRLAEETAAYTSTKGSLHFPVNEPLPGALVRKLLEVRMPKPSTTASPNSGKSMALACCQALSAIAAYFFPRDADRVPRTMASRSRANSSVQANSSTYFIWHVRSGASRATRPSVAPSRPASRPRRATRRPSRARTDR